MRKQELMFAILKVLASQDVEIIGEVSSKFCRTASAFCVRPTPTISRSRRYLHLLADPPLLAEDGRYGRRPIRD